MVQMKKNAHLIKAVLFSIIVLFSTISIAHITFDISVTIETDKTSYYPGETIYAKGRLTDNGIGIAGSMACLDMYYPNGTVLSGICGWTNDTGYINYNQELESDTVLGLYLVSFHSLVYDLYANTTIEVISAVITVDAGGPYYSESGEVEFQGSASGGEPAYSWLWDFGDGKTSTEQNPIYTYDVEGNYTVTLTVTDQANNTGEDETWAIIALEGDTTPPHIEINQPINALYLMNKQLIPFPTAVVIGNIDIIFSAADDESGLDYVDFYINDDLKETFSSNTESWPWNEKTPMQFKHTLTFEAFDNAGNNATAEIVVYKFL